MTSRIGALIVALAASAGCVFYQDLDPPAESDAGTGGPVEPDAFVDPVCPPDCPGRVTVGGQLVFIEDGNPVRADNAVGNVCATATATGPCSLEVFAVDALQFVQNPDGAAPLMQIPVTDRGELVSTVFPAPALSYAGLVVRQRDGGTNWVTTAVMFEATGGSVYDGLSVPVTSAAIDVEWTATAGNPFGAQTFSERGATFVRYTDSGGPRDGVLFTSSGSSWPTKDFYFNGTGASSTIDPAQARTGSLGTALAVDVELVEQSGAGSEPSGCEWASTLSAAVPGAILYHEVRAIDPNTGEPCP